MYASSIESEMCEEVVMYLSLIRRPSAGSGHRFALQAVEVTAPCLIDAARVTPVCSQRHTGCSGWRFFVEY
jgi:hypothetical protein